MIMKKNTLQKILMVNYRNITEVLPLIKYTISNKDTREIFDKIIKGVLPGKKILLYGNCCSSLNELGSNLNITFSENESLAKEFEWLTLKIHHYSKEINSFLELKKVYMSYFLKGNYYEALKIINEINKLTISFWGIEQELLCLELMNGFESNNEKLSEMAQNTDRLLTLALIRFSSDRVSTLNTFDTFEHKLNNFTESITDDFSKDTLESYFKLYFLEQYSEINIEDAKKILSLVNTFSFIDIYEVYIKLLTVLSAFNRISYEQIKNFIGLIPIKILDSRVENIKMYYQPKYISDKINSEKYDASAKIIEDYTLNNYEKVYEQFYEYNEEYGLSFTNIDLIAKNLIYFDSKIENYFQSDNIWIKQMVELIKNIYTLDNKLNETSKRKNLEHLKNISKLFAGINFSIEMNAFYFEQLGEEDKSQSLWKMGTTYSDVLTPLRIKESNNSTLFHYLQSVGFNQSIEIIESIDINNHDFRSKFYKAKNLIDTNINTSINLLESLKDSYCNLDYPHQIYEYERVIRELYKLYIKVGNSKAALDLFINCYFRSKDFITRLDGTKILDCIKKEENLDLMKLNILKYILNPSNSYETFVSLSELTSKANLSLPSDFIKPEKFNLENMKENKKLLFYLLENLYKIDVMKHFVYLHPGDRNKERMQVLEFLINEGYGDLKSKQKERNTIKKAISIQKRIRQVDQKKIFVDTEAIINEFKEIYQVRYKNFILLEKLDTSITYYDTNDTSSIIKFGQDLKVEIKSNPKKEMRFILFKEIILDYYKELTLNKKYGLEKFLSSRIRHGLLENTLTKTFNKYNLLSLKGSSSDDSELINHYRISQLLEFDISDVKAGDLILAYFDEFSATVMNTIEKVKNWIKVYTNNQQTGLFDYRPYENSENLFNLYSDFNDIKNFNVFYTKLTDEFWRYTELLLDNIKDRINKEIAEEFDKSLSLLESKLYFIAEDSPNLNQIVGYISRDIRNAQANFRSDIAEVCNWLVVRRSNEFHDFHLKELTETAIEIVKNGNQTFTTSEIINLNIKIKGEYFNYFIDILTMLYNNAKKHSGYSDLSELRIDTRINKITVEDLPQQPENEKFLLGIKYTEMEKLFRENPNHIMVIEVSNNLSKSIDENSILEKIHEKIISYQTEQTEEMILGEGGTGIIKITSILDFNINTDYYNLFYIDEGIMYALIICDYSILEVNNEDINN